MKRLAIVATVALWAATWVSTSPAQATYPGQNGLIAFGFDPGDGLDIYTVSPDWSGLTRLTDETDAALHPDWSPDGSKIVFEEAPVGTTDACRVMLMDADGSNVVDLTRNHHCDSDPSFTPSGRRIIFLAQGGYVVKTMDLTGHDRQTLFHRGDLYKHNPTMSPNGHKILFLVEKDIPGGNRKGLAIAHRDGTNIRMIVPFRFDVSVRGGDWAPDGHRIAFTSEAGPTPVPGEPSNLFTIRPDGTGLRQLTHYRSPDIRVRIGTCSYSPNGRWILFKGSNLRNPYFIKRIHPDGSGLMRVAKLDGPAVGAVDWGPAPA
jgi:Tol biopolymer transport system component